MLRSDWTERKSSESENSEKALDLKQENPLSSSPNSRQNSNGQANASANKKLKSDAKQDSVNDAAPLLLMSNQNEEVNMPTSHLSQIQLNWLLSQRNPLQTNRLAQNTTPILNGQLMQNSNFNGENFNCLSSLFNSNMAPQSSASNLNFQINMNAYQMGKNPFTFNPFANLSQPSLAANINPNSENVAALAANQAETIAAQKRLLEIFNCYNIMNNNVAAASLLANQFNPNNLNLIENQSAQATAQQLNLALSSMSNSAAGL